MDETLLEEERAKMYSELRKKFGPSVNQHQINDFIFSELINLRTLLMSMAYVVKKNLEVDIKFLQRMEKENDS